MVVRLQTMDGRTRVYETHRGVGGGENGPDKYVTKCGMEWKIEPRPYETCAHIECALDTQRGSADSGAMAFLIFLGLGVVSLFMIEDLGIGVLALAFGVLLGLWTLIEGAKAGDRVHELNEYMSKGTINGIRAYVAPESEMLAELKTAKECVRYGLALHGQGKYDNAIKAFDRATELDPQFADAWYNKGMALNDQDKYAEAIRAYDIAAEVDPRHAKAWYSKGLILGSQGKYDEAVHAYNKATEIDPKNGNAWYNKGMALRSLGRTTEADAALDIAKNKLNCRGTHFFNYERYAEAIKAYDMALEADPKYVIAWINKGTALLRLGMYSEALRAFNHAIEMEPQNGDAWNRKGIVLKKMGRNAEATDAFAKANELGYAAHIGSVPYLL